MTTVKNNALHIYLLFLIIINYYDIKKYGNCENKLFTCQIALLSEVQNRLYNYLILKIICARDVFIIEFKKY